jgi:large subunit ribosomal protein L15
MISLESLQNTHRPYQKVQRVGRGFGSHRGKTCKRGSKGHKSRSGYKRRYGREGGQLPLYRKLPCRGFSNERFKNKTYAINFNLINKIFDDGEVVNLETLRMKGYAPRETLSGLKILAGGELMKKVSVEATAISSTAKVYFDTNKIPYSLV